MLHIIQNDPEVPPGNLIEFLANPYVVHHPYRDAALPEVSRIRALIVLGGAMGANDDRRYPFLSDLKILIRNCVESGIPYLGICLGGQLLAAALGSKVVSSRWEELGTLPVKLTEAGKKDQIFTGFSEEFTTFQWHHDSFDIPENGELLAYSAACPHQAFRVSKCAWGLQFHPEVTESIIRTWCTWGHSTSARTEELVADFSGNEEKYRSDSRRFLGNFLKDIDRPA